MHLRVGKVLGGIVFSDKSKLESLNRLVWPAIHAILQNKIEELKNNSVPDIVVEAAVMIEAGWESSVDELWTIETSHELAW